MQRFKGWLVGALMLALVAGWSGTGLARGSITLYLPLVAGGGGAGPLVTEPSNHLTVSSATYLGGAQAEAANAIDIGADSGVIWGGALTDPLPGGIVPTVLLGDGPGSVALLSEDGQSLRHVTRLGNVVHDLEASDGGPMVVCGDFGVAMLDASATALLWHEAIGEATRCAIGANGHAVVALVGGMAHVYDGAGTPHGSWAIGGSEQADVALYGPGALVIATGYSQRSADLQVAFLKAWTLTGSPAWTSYDFQASQVPATLGADTRGRRVAIGRDGKLYFAATTNGGTGSSIFVRDPKNINQSLGADRYVTTDPYNTPSNVGSVTLTWYGRYTPSTGALEQGQPLLTRLSSGAGNSIAPHAITADQWGTIYLVGESYASIQDRSSRQVAGQGVGPYSGGEAFLLVVQPDLRQRLIWTPFAGPEGAGGSPARGVAVRDRVAALTIHLRYSGGSPDRSLLTHEALQPMRGGGAADGYIALWGRQ